MRLSVTGRPGRTLLAATVVAIVAAGACGDSDPAAGAGSGAAGTTATTVPGIPPEEPVPGGESYVEYLAELNGVSLEEAAVLADLVEQLVDVHVFAQTDQAATFAGLWVEHNPFRVMVAYTDDASGAAAELHPLLSEPDVLVPIDATHTARQLDEAFVTIFAAQTEPITGLEALQGADYGGTIVVQENVIRIRTLDGAVASALGATYPADLVDVVIDTPPTTVLD